MPLFGDDAREILDSSARPRLALDGRLQLPAPPRPPSAAFELCPRRARVGQVPLRFRECLLKIRPAAVDGEDGAAFVLERGYRGR